MIEILLLCAYGCFVFFMMAPWVIAVWSLHKSLDSPYPPEGKP